MSLLEAGMRFAFLSLSIASIYLLVAVGFSIIFGSLKFVNLAHGALYLLGAYVALFIAGELVLVGALSRFSPIGLDWGFAAALILTPLVIFILGILMDKFLAKKLTDRSLLDQLLITFGVLLLIQELVAILIGRRGFSIDRPGWASGSMMLPGVGTASRWRFYVILLTALAILFLYIIYRYTNFGLVLRAATEDHEMVQLLGIRSSRPFTFIFALGAGYAGLAGILGGSMFAIHPEIGVEILIPALVIVVIGGVGSLTGTVVASILAGTAFVTVSYISPGASSASMYLLGIIILALKPTGLFESTLQL